MKLIRVNHTRCDYGDVQGVTYLIRPEGKTDAQINEDLLSAIDEYVKSKKCAAELLKPASSYAFSIDCVPETTTIAEFKALREANTLEWQKYNHRMRIEGGDFEYHINKLGYMTLQQALGYSDSDDLQDSENIDLYETGLYWGHNHGETFEYSKTDNRLPEIPKASESSLITSVSIPRK